MDLNNEKYRQANDILNNLFKEPTLRELLERRLHDLNLNQTNALKLLKMERKAFLGIIDGTQRRTDYTNFEKLAALLNIQTEELIQKHTALLQKNFEQKESSKDKIKFMRERFDLVAFKKAGFINDVNDENEIEFKINRLYGFNSIFEYEKRSFNVMFSAPNIESRSLTTIEKIGLARDNWLTMGRQLAVRLDNPYQYDREGLIKYFPQIRWYSTNVEFGLINVIKALFKLGITVIYQSPLSSLHLRGATIPVMGKPCILLTDHKGFYSTIWHALIHELYHVLFEWLDIKSNDKPHLTEDVSQVFTITDNELDADNFAREYLFSRKKMEDVKLYLKDQEFIEETAKNNNVHSSFIYTYYAFDYDKIDRMAWARAKKQTPSINTAVYRLENPFNKSMPIDDFAKKLRLEIYN
jgi:HTH-type transcriptional regulator / antitoxin HigA